MAIRAITFDVYAALFDTPGGLTHAVAELFNQRGHAGDSFAVARAWRQKQREYLLVANSLDREPASNRKAIEAAVHHTLRDLAPPLTRDEVRALVVAWERLPPWPEAADVLTEVRRRRLIVATLSNGDGDMLRTLLAALPVAFDHVISTEGGKFKPHPSAYRRALEILGFETAELLHVAGAATDAMGATAAGIRTVWVNRMGDAVVDPRFAPAHEVANLRGVLGILDAS